MVNQNKLKPKHLHGVISKIHLKIARKIQWREQVVFQLISRGEIQMWPHQYQALKFRVKRSILLVLHQQPVLSKNQDANKPNLKINFWDSLIVNLDLSKRNLKRRRLIEESIHHGGVKACWNRHQENKIRNQQPKRDLHQKHHLKEVWERSRKQPKTLSKTLNSSDQTEIRSKSCQQLRSHQEDWIHHHQEMVSVILLHHMLMDLDQVSDQITLERTTRYKVLILSWCKFKIKIWCMTKTKEMKTTILMVEFLNTIQSNSRSRCKDQTHEKMFRKSKLKDRDHKLQNLKSSLDPIPLEVKDQKDLAWKPTTSISMSIKRENTKHISKSKFLHILRTFNREKGISLVEIDRLRCSTINKTKCTITSHTSSIIHK